MTEEENILKMIVEKESWEEIIYYIVGLEKLNPWDVDLIKLTGGFIRFIKNSEELDFRIPAKVIFVASLLLRLKADYLSIFEEKEEEIKEMLKEEKPFAELGIDPNLVQLGYPVKRVPKRQVTLDELISALRKALTVHEKKVERVKIIRQQVNQVKIEEDITQKTEKMLKDIDDLIEKLKTTKIEFKQLVQEWKRDKIVEKLIPLLYLEQNKKVVTEQEEHFKDIMISKTSSSE
jgi:segregation and condensation protein A